MQVIDKRDFPPNPKAPSFDHRNGFFWPASYHILRSIPFWPIGKFLPNSRIAVDAYVVSCWIIELVLLLFCGLRYSWLGWCGWVLVVFAAWRFVDILWVLLSILLTGTWSERRGWSEPERVLLHVILNAFEIMIIFAAFYRVLGVLVPQCAKTLPPLGSFLEALCFSVVTATTLGYGKPAPVGWVSMLLASIETCTMVLVIVVLIGFIVGIRKKPKFD